MKSIEDLQRELEETKARAAIPALSAEEDVRASLRAEIATARAKIEENERKARDAREDAIFEELEAQQGDTLRRMDAAGGMIVLKMPSIAKSRHFQNVAVKGKLSADAFEDFVRPCVVYPPVDEFEARIERFPLLVPTLVNELQDMASGEAKARGKR